MTVENIIKAVRWCIDEEKLNDADFNNASGNDDTYMDNIIMDKIGDAIRWVSLYGPADLLGGTDDESLSPVSPGILISENIAYNSTTVTQNGITLAYTQEFTNSPVAMTLPAKCIRLARVRASSWHRAISEAFAEDSEEALQASDPNGAEGTQDRPIVLKVNSEPQQYLLYGKLRPFTGEIVHVTYVASAEAAPIYGTGQQSGTIIGYAMPPKAATAIVYYIAFLLLSAYGDERANRMLEIAKMNLGK